MVHDRQRCPLDDSRLVYLSGSYGERGVDLSVCYCPRCDVAVVFLAKAESASAPSVLYWRRRGDQLQLQEEDRGRWNKLPRQFRAAWESNVRHHVKLFLGGRFSEAVRCPEDAGRIPVLHRWDETTATPSLLAWCWYCGMGFVFIRDPGYGWEHSADVTWDATRRSYRITETRETGGHHSMDPQALRDLPPPPVPPDRIG